MADVSVRFAMTNDSEILLNLSMPQAIRLMEAIARKVSEILPAATSAASVPAGRSGSVPNLGTYPSA